MLAIAGAAMPLLWLRTEAAERRTGRLHATGLLELGLAPDQLLLALVPEEAALLRAAADATRCAGLGTVLIEAWGIAPALDLTASRRLKLAAEQSGVTVLVLRAQAEPTPSATTTRWRVEARPSTALDANTPGAPTFSVELLRCRGAPAGTRWQVEWNRDDRCFRSAPLHGAGFPVAFDRAAAFNAPAPVRRRA